MKKEDEYAEKEYKTPYLWQASEKETLRAQQRHAKKRRTLKHYFNRAAYSEAQGEDIYAYDRDELGSETSSCSGESFSSSGEILNSDDDDIIDMTELSQRASVTELQQPNLSASTEAPGSRKRKHCANCNKECVINKACSTNSCPQCCYASTQFCKAHNRKKIGASKPYLDTLATSLPKLDVEAVARGVDLQAIEDKVEAAISKKQSLYILYISQDGRESFSRITPEVFEESKNGRKVRAHCHWRNEPRSFFLRCMQRIEDHDWNTLSTSQCTAPGIIIDIAL